MSKAPVISMDELEVQLRGLESAQPEGFSVAEMSDRLNMSEHWCRVKLKKLVKEGRAKFNGKKRGTMLDGRKHFTPIYVLLAKTQAL